MSSVSPCFTPGTLIATDRGWRPVERLRQGNRVVTRDNGLKRVVWVGRRDLGYGDLAECPDLHPVLIRQGALGDGLPVRDTLVSPDHRLLSWPHAGEETLVSASQMADLPGVDAVPVLGVSYLHILLDRHEVVLANGVWTESFHPDDVTLGGMAEDARREILSLFPEIETQGAARRFPSARPIRKSRFEL